MENKTSTSFENLTGREIIEKREANVKHFDLGQGRRQAVVFASPVHFKNEKSGAWEEIDNRLVEKTDAKGRRRFENKSGAFRARFFEDADGGSLASMKSGDTEFSWSYPGARVSKPAHTKKALPTAFGRGLFRLQITYHFNLGGNVVDTNDEMWYTYGTKIDKSIENTPSDNGRVRKAFSQCSLKPKGALV